MAAFVDRTPIDWSALLDRSRDAGHRASIDVLRDLDCLRGRHAVDHHLAPANPISLLTRMLLAVAALQTAWGIGTGAIALAKGEAAADLPSQLLLAAAFALASLLLAAASSRDPRACFLLVTFTFAGSAFARAMFDTFTPTSALSNVLLRGVYPEAFAHAALWRFAVVFPHVRRFTAFDVCARRIAAMAFVVSAGLFVANLLLAYGLAAGPLRRLERNDPHNLFWHLFVVSALPALATILIRTYRAPREERAKVARFAMALVGGAAPLVLTGLTRMLLPGMDGWMSNAGGAMRLCLDIAIVGGLAMVPILTTVALLIDHPLEIESLAPRSLRRWIARCSFRCHQIAESRSLRRQPHHQRLSAALDRVRLARGSREIAAVLKRELPFSVGFGCVEILDTGDLPARTALVPLLDAVSAPIELARDREPFRLLPRDDRDWLDARKASVLAAIRLRDGTLARFVVLGRGHADRRLSRSDRWFISTLLTGAAAAWDAAPPTREGLESVEQSALECARCGQVGEAISLGCCADPEVRLAALPQHLNGRFTVLRRLGAGGMGVVYLAHDTALQREVALKTLPAVRGTLASRLCGEARAMAALNHGALATIYGLEFWRRTPVLVVEYFPGGTLADRIARSMRPFPEVVATGIQLADALTYMHDRGMLHRDLKPSNIGLTSDGRPKLLDFGLTTECETPAGTPEYLPPEALDGSPPNAAVDLWGLSMVLLKACGGRSNAPAAACAFFDRALAASPGERFGSSREMRIELLRLAGESYGTDACLGP